MNLYSASDWLAHVLRIPAPASFEGATSEYIVVCDVMRASSEAATVTSPSASIEPSSTIAVERLLTMLEARIPLALIPPAPMIAAGAEVAAFESSARICAVFVAVTETPPAETIGEPVTDASDSAGWRAPPNAFEISGSPSSASTAANRRFVRPQPTVLNASRIPIDCEPDAIATRFVASISESFEAETVTSPTVVSIALSSTSARAELRTRLVAMTPPAASDWPWPVNERAAGRVAGDVGGGARRRMPRSPRR